MTPSLELRLRQMEQLAHTEGEAELARIHLARLSAQERAAAFTEHLKVTSRPGLERLREILLTESLGGAPPGEIERLVVAETVRLIEKELSER